MDRRRTLQSNVQRTTQNLKVTVLPDIRENAGLNGQAFDTTLPDDVQNWFETLNESWKTCELSSAFYHNPPHTVYVY